MDVNCSIHVQIMYSMLSLWLFSVSFYRFVGLRLVHLFKLLFYSCYFMVNLSLMSDHDGQFCFSVHKFNHIVYPVPPSYIFFYLEKIAISPRLSFALKLIGNNERMYWNICQGWIFMFALVSPLHSWYKRGQQHTAHWICIHNECIQLIQTKPGNIHTEFQHMTHTHTQPIHWPWKEI